MRQRSSFTIYRIYIDIQLGHRYSIRFQAKMAPAPTSTAPSRGPTALQKPTKVRYYKGKPAGAERDPNSDTSDEDNNDEGDDDEGQQLLRRPGKPRRAAEVEVDQDVVAGGAGRVFRPQSVAVGSKGKVSVGSVKMELGDVKVGRDEVKKGM